MFEQITTALQQRGSSQLAHHQSKYMKGVVEFRGLNATSTNEVFKPFQQQVSQLPLNVAFSLAETFLSSKYFEDKYVGILILKRKLKEIKHSHFPILESYFDKNYIYEWATCDGISSKVIGELIKKDSACAKELLSWKESTNLWKQRASCVSFVKVARFGNYTDLILPIVETCVKNRERFVQLGVGWVVRELFLAEPQKVVDFLTENYSFLSREGLRYAIEKMDTNLKQRLLNYEPDSGEAITVGTARNAKRKRTTKKEDDEEISDSEEEQSDKTQTRKRTLRKHTTNKRSKLTE